MRTGDYRRTQYGKEREKGKCEGHCVRGEGEIKEKDNIRTGGYRRTQYEREKDNCEGDGKGRDKGAT